MDFEFGFELTRRDWQYVLVGLMVLLMSGPALANVGRWVWNRRRLSIERRRALQEVSVQINQHDSDASSSEVSETLKESREVMLEKEVEELRAMRRKPYPTVAHQRHRLSVPTECITIPSARVPSQRKNSRTKQNLVDEVQELLHASSQHSSLPVVLSDRQLVVPTVSTTRQSGANEQSSRPNTRFSSRVSTADDTAMLRAQQDLEYEECKRLDLERQQKEQQLLAKKQLFRERVVAEPHASTESTITLRFRLPLRAGTALKTPPVLQRRFLSAKHTLLDVLHFLDSLELVPICLEVPESTRITCSLNAPRISFSHADLAKDGSVLLQTLAECSIVTDSVVWVHIDE